MQFSDFHNCQIIYALRYNNNFRLRDISFDLAKCRRSCDKTLFLWSKFRRHFGEISRISLRNFRESSGDIWREQ